MFDSLKFNESERNELIGILEKQDIQALENVADKENLLSSLQQLGIQPSPRVKIAHYLLSKKVPPSKSFHLWAHLGCEIYLFFFVFLIRMPARNSQKLIGLSICFKKHSDLISFWAASKKTQAQLVKAISGNNFVSLFGRHSKNMF